MKTLALISDAVLLTTGFAQVAKQLAYGFHEAGFNVQTFGTMYYEPDTKGVLPFGFWPVSHFDQMGHSTVALFLTNIQPDIIVLLYDPGNSDVFLHIIQSLQKAGQLKQAPVILYTVIEGFPVQPSTAKTIDLCQQMGGRVVLCSPGAVEMVTEAYEFDKPLDWAYYGLDHANFRQYSDSYRNHLRDIVGFNDYFLVGSFGVNKRTKGFDTLIYTARCLKDMNKHHGIKFYLHTAMEHSTMWGHNLRELATTYDVLDMILSKPEIEKEPGGNIKGINRDSTDFIELFKPATAIERKALFATYGYIDRMNCLDLYLDISQVEGWGLPVMEAMKCGVPVAYVHDYSIRDEMIGEFAHGINPEPVRKWTTWHTGVKLVLVDPEEVAKQVLYMKDQPQLRDQYSLIGQEHMNQLKWKDTQEKFVKIVNEVLSE